MGVACNLWVGLPKYAHPTSLFPIEMPEKHEFCLCGLMHG